MFLPALVSLAYNGCEILEIYTCKTDNITEFNTGIIAFAKKNGIRYTLDRIKNFDVERLKTKGCEMIFSAGYYYKIPVSDDIPAVNLHPSLLPYGRGPWPMPLDILNEKKMSGVTIHKISEGFDEGDILMQRSFNLDSKETLVSFMQKVYKLIPEMISEIVSDFDSLYKNAVKQGKGEYLPMPEKEMYTLDEATAYEKAERVLRAFLGYDCYYNDRRGVSYMMIGASAVKSVSENMDKTNFVFPVKDGYVVCKKENTTLIKKESG